ncbi:hypothetical protein OSB04_024829 [Centaurea solstitialis]|uniref:Uncharacterized protein n=1 Tax=Centaurea solstitialis TaxID=347529 RepID=A0AA38W123_9ASTR|nr:hypothetical protein OSB04_024829 [Centaurea solstitialis]
MKKMKKERQKKKNKDRVGSGSGGPESDRRAQNPSRTSDLSLLNPSRTSGAHFFSNHSFFSQINGLITPCCHRHQYPEFYSNHFGDG